MAGLFILRFQPAEKHSVIYSNVSSINIQAPKGDYSLRQMQIV
jgi:hypothetical protein